MRTKIYDEIPEYVENPSTFWIFLQTVYRLIRSVLGHKTSIPRVSPTYPSYLSQLSLQLRLSVSRTMGIREASEIVSTYKFTPSDLREQLDHPLRSLPKIKKIYNHTHPTSANERTSANLFLCDVARQAGYDPYVVSMSSSDQRNKERGCKYYYWPKDLTSEYQDDEIKLNDCLIFIDVDFHCDMNRYLQLFKPMLLYTLVPEKAAYHDDEHSYTIKDDVIKYFVRGGAQYEHKVWDYSGDTITTLDEQNNLLTYHLSQHKIEGSPNRRLISILPACMVYSPAWMTMPFSITGLKRKRITQNGVNILYDNVQQLLSISKNDSAEEITISPRLFRAIKHRLETKSGDGPNIGDIENFLFSERKALKYAEGIEIDNIKVEASLLHEMYNIPLSYIPNVVATNEIRTFYQPTAPLVTVDPKDPTLLLTTPMVTNPSLFAAKSLNSEMAAIDGRVKKVMNNTKPPREYQLFAKEFVERLVQHRHVGIPWNLDQVIAQQNRPLQRGRTARVLHELGLGNKNQLKSFNKMEAYNGTNDPRIITTMSPHLTIQMSAYTYPFKDDVLKPQHWYGPGKSPEKSIKRIQRTVTDGAIMTDYSRFDGSISSWLYNNVVRNAYMRWIEPNSAPLFLRYFKQVFQTSGTTALGHKYDAGPGTRSGSPITTDANTMINAFITFASLRQMGFSIEDAWLKMGIYSGDDGLNNLVPGLDEQILRTSHLLGLTVELTTSFKDEEITYLGRIFPRPLSSRTSYQDIKRTLPKLHITSRKPMSREQAAVNRAHGYLVTDSMTPLVANWCNKVLDLNPDLKLKNPSNEELYKIETGPWPQFEVDLDLVSDSICSKLNITHDELAARCNAINAVENMDTFPIVWDNPVENKLQSLVNGEITTGRRVTYTDTQNARYKAKQAEPTSTSKENSGASNKSRTTRAGVREVADKNTRPLHRQRRATPSEGPSMGRKGNRDQPLRLPRSSRTSGTPRPQNNERRQNNRHRRERSQRDKLEANNTTTT